LSYVMCDRCGAPADPADEVAEARAIARRAGFIRAAAGRRRYDICKACSESKGCQICGRSGGELSENGCPSCGPEAEVRS
jgi:hypothetical protein